MDKRAFARMRTVPRPNLQNAVLFHRWEQVAQLPVELAVYHSVFWEPEDTVSLRASIATTPLVRGRTVLEIGTGSGLLALCCLQAGARRVVATDVNPAAVACARDNARRMQFADRLDVRLVPADNTGAYAVIDPGETFDLIISNPPWEDGTPQSIGQFALYDPGFALIDSLLAGARQHLNPGGKVLLAYGHQDGIRKVLQLAAHYGYTATILDQRRLDDLPESFLPGMLIELTLPDLPAPR